MGMSNHHGFINHINYLVIPGEFRDVYFAKSGILIPMDLFWLAQPGSLFSRVAEKETYRFVIKCDIM